MIVVQEHKDWSLNCSRCDFSIFYRGRTKKYVQRALRQFNELPDVGEPCPHILVLNELR